MSFLRSVCNGAAAFALASIVFVPTSATAQTAVNELSEAEKRSGWELLFDGESADAWRNYQKDSLSDGWPVIDGALVRAKKGAGDIVSKQSSDAFELLLDYKISPEGNSGLMFHVTEDNPRPWHSGPEIQIRRKPVGCINCPGLPLRGPPKTRRRSTRLGPPGNGIRSICESLRKAAKSA